MKKTAKTNMKKNSISRAKIRIIAVFLSVVAALSVSGIFTGICADSAARVISSVLHMVPRLEKAALEEMNREVQMMNAKPEERSLMHDALKSDEMHGEAARKANAEGGRLRMLIDDFRDVLQDESDFVKRKESRTQKRMTWQSMGVIISDSSERAVPKCETLL